MRKIFILFTIIFAKFGLNNIANAQCNIVSGTSGTIHDSASTTSVSYTVSVSQAASFENIGAETSCGLTFPGIIAPWSGNSNSIDTVTYTFSEPIIALNIFIAYVGVTGSIAPETFTLTTNGSTPVLAVDAGTCAAWTLIGNQITSPSVINGLNSIVSLSSATPFTTLSIVSGTNSSVNGGSSYGLCDASLLSTLENLISNPNIITFYPNPSSGKFTIHWNNENVNKIEIYNLLGENIYTQTIKKQTSKEIDFSSSPKGIYFVKIYNEEKSHTEKIVVQ